MNILQNQVLSTAAYERHISLENQWEKKTLKKNKLQH